jgi:hypothetical protein
LLLDCGKSDKIVIENFECKKEIVLKNLVSIITLFLLSGCTFPSDSASEKEKADVSSSKSSEPTGKLKQSIKKMQLNTLQKSFNINVSKMIVSEFPIIKGTKIFDTDTNSYATVLGAIVVVINQGLTIDNLDTSGFETKKIANNTYSLSPQDKNTDVYELYKLLLKNSELSQVELSLFYSSLREKEEW